MCVFWALETTLPKSLQELTVIVLNAIHVICIQHLQFPDRLRLPGPRRNKSIKMIGCYWCFLPLFVGVVVALFAKIYRYKYIECQCDLHI